MSIDITLTMLWNQFWKCFSLFSDICNKDLGDFLAVCLSPFKKRDAVERRQKLCLLNIYWAVVGKIHCYLFEIFTFHLFHSFPLSPLILHASENHLWNNTLMLPEGIHIQLCRSCLANIPPICENFQTGSPAREHNKTVKDC